MTEPVVRTATRGDVPAIIELWFELMTYHGRFEPHLTLRDRAGDLFEPFLRENIAIADAIVLVAEEEGRIVAYTMARVQQRPPVLRTCDVVQIMDISVTRRHWRRGIATRLVDEVKSWAVTIGVPDIEVQVSTRNPPGLAFWQSVGGRSYLQTMVIDPAEP